MSYIDYAKLNKEELIELKECMERNLRISENEAMNIAGLLEEKEVELARLEEIEIMIKLCKECLVYLDEKIKEKE